AEIFHLWVIEGDKRFAEELPFTDIGINVIWTDDVAPYKKRKVRILNGAHTMSVLAARLAGLESVGEMMNDEDFMAYINKGLFDEIIPVLDLPKEELEYFANAVIERFKNPFIKHLLLSIALNSVSKYKVRVLPSLLEYNAQFGKLPEVLTFGLAALIEFYKGDEANDDAAVMEFMKSASVAEILANTSLWDTDLSFMEPTVSAYAAEIEANGVRAALKKIIA
ncbi:MAG: tagaturonate reductase, partial [Candidatus Ornithomonoglobus sp.]